MGIWHGCVDSTYCSARSSYSSVPTTTVLPLVTQTVYLGRLPRPSMGPHVMVVTRCSMRWLATTSPACMSHTMNAPRLPLAARNLASGENPSASTRSCRPSSTCTLRRSVASQTMTGASSPCGRPRSVRRQCHDQFDSAGAAGGARAHRVLDGRDLAGSDQLTAARHRNGAHFGVVPAQELLVVRVSHVLDHDHGAHAAGWGAQAANRSSGPFQANPPRSGPTHA